MRKYVSAWFYVLTVALCSVALPANAQLVAGRDYAVIDPAQPTENAGKIEVIEFFSYACPHCNDLNPLIQKWATKLPPDVTFKRVPVSFNPFYQLMARLYFTLETTGDLARLDAPLFAAIHTKGLRLVSEKAIMEWCTSQGVDALKFTEAWNSFGVATKTSRADQMGRDHHIQGVPAIAVDGRYLIGGKSLQEMMILTDKVIEKRRAERRPSTDATKRTPQK